MQSAKTLIVCGSPRTQVQALLDALDDHREETRANFRSVEEQLAQIKDLIVDGFRGRGQQGR